MFRYITIIFLFILPAEILFAFCGFYVAKADASLFNKASRVVLVRNENKTVITMMNDYKGELKDFAMVIPVPVILQKDQVHVGEAKVVDHIDGYSAPRLVEYFDENPCDRRRYEMEKASADSVRPAPSQSQNKPSNNQGVTVEATYTVGEYDIVILSAKYSNGLEDWLIQNGYKIPKGASVALKPYINQKMKFFVAKVNLKEQSKSGLTFLRPLQFAMESQKFMLPIRLGMINAQGDQDLLLYVLTKNGRVETTNYRTIQLPSNLEVPMFVKKEFANFYRDMFANQVQKENGRAVFTEYVWNMGWCDPCASEPLSKDELQSLGVFWLNDNEQKNPWNGGAMPVMITRLHIRYNNDTFPEDLMFQETKDTNNYQGRYILHHPWTGNRNECSEAETYFQNLSKREEARAKNLVMLTGWDLNTVHKKMNFTPSTKQDNKWWKKIWK
ncbi:MAG: DUF2330 domain-containing protein [Leptospiraceae bacterium]|nr:DUF2330 domain-containing protein [Leptospiraceae bacterium]